MACVYRQSGNQLVNKNGGIPGSRKVTREHQGGGGDPDYYRLHSLRFAVPAPGECELSMIS